MKNNFVPANDPVLIKTAKKVSASEILSKDIKDIIQKMLKIAGGQRKDAKKPFMVGLAAPQIGISKRIILVDIGATGKRRFGAIKVYINPKIIWTSKKEEEWYEGCYSTDRVCGIVSRPRSIKLKAIKFIVTQGTRATVPHRVWHSEKVEEKYTGYVARIFQHEIDHLNGKVFVDHITNPENLHWVKKSEFKLYRNEKMWENWPKKCSFEKWRFISKACKPLKEVYKQSLQTPKGGL